MAQGLKVCRLVSKLTEWALAVQVMHVGGQLPADSAVGIVRQKPRASAAPFDVVASRRGATASALFLLEFGSASSSVCRAKPVATYLTALQAGVLRHH